MSITSNQAARQQTRELSASKRELLEKRLRGAYKATMQDHAISRHAEAQRLLREEAYRPFDLASGAVLRWRLLRLAEQEHVLVIAMHHIVSDGWSMGVFFRELQALYGAFLNETQAPLPDLPIQYAD